MRKSRRSQRGDALITTSLALVVLIILSVMLARYLQTLSYQNRANLALTRIENVVDAMQRAYMANMVLGVAPNSINAYPGNGAALIAAGYLENCIAADEANGLCINRLKLPWVDSSNNDETIDITTFIDPADNHPAFTVTFSLGNIYPVKQRNIIRTRISQLPDYTEDGSNNVTITYTRPGSEVSLENLVRRDGSTPMTADWDFGDVYLDNVKDISFTGISDRTALTGSLKLGSVLVSSSAGVSVAYNTCQAGYTPQIEVWTQSLGTSTLQYNVKAFASWYVDDGSKWIVHFRSTAENSSGTKTYYYTGTVVYATWCDFS